MIRAKQNQNRRTIKSGYGHKNPWDPSEKVREIWWALGSIYRKGKVWVWTLEWNRDGVMHIVKVMMMMVMMMNRWEKDEITVTWTHHRGEVLWDVHSRDEVI